MDITVILYRVLAFWGACSLLFTLVWAVCGWLSHQTEQEDD